MENHSFKLKALVDKANERIVYLESGGDLVDVLLSILTMPVGNIIRLICNPPPTISIGCLNNLYSSVKDLDVGLLRTKECREILLRPQSGAETYCKDLKLKIDDYPPPMYFYCGDFDCITSKSKLLSQFKGVCCDCGREMSYEATVKTRSKNVEFDSQDGGVFVRECARFIISDSFDVIPSSSAASFSLISKLGIMDASSIEERIFNIGVAEVFKLLKSSLVSRFPLTEALLGPKELPQLSNETVHQISKSSSNEKGKKISVSLFISKSKKRVCYAEVREDFVDLIFSFLVIPIGHILKQVSNTASNGSMHHVYESTKDLDTENYFKSNDLKEILLNPKIASGYAYKNQLLEVEEVACQQYYLLYRYTNGTACFSTNKPQGNQTKDPKSPHKRVEHGGGFVMRPAMYTVTDDLIVTPISPVTGLSILKKLNVLFDDIEERNVHVGNQEASRLLVASFVSQSALTDTFLHQKIKQEYY